MELYHEKTKVLKIIIDLLLTFPWFLYAFTLIHIMHEFNSLLIDFVWE